MSYVDAILDRKTDKIRIAERQQGKRILREVPAQYVFYYEHTAGTHRSIFGHPAKRFSSPSSQKFRMALSEQMDNGCRIFESDLNPVFRYLATNYANVDAPTLNLGFFDIEADFHPEKAFAPPTDPFNAITALTLYRTADQRLLTFVLKPPTVSYEDAEASAKAFEDTQLFDDEAKMLEAFLEAIEDVDVLTSWNGSYYDIPYTVNRVARVLNKEATKRFCLFDQFPFEREYKNKFGKTIKTFDLVGRVHLDYLELYAKHNSQQRLSYALNSIGQMVVGESKVAYEGSLDDLYKKEFKKFIEYNRQDVALMVKIDAKLKYIELHNQVAHANGVVLKTTMGSVALVEQAIINEMHAMGFVVPNRKSKDVEPDDVDTDVDDYDEEDEDDEPWKHVDEGRTPVVGAYVAQPRVGLQSEIGCVDINSLYPSAIRALNMSPETLIGQVRMDETMRLVHERALKLSKTKRAEAWDGLFSTLEVSHMHDQDDKIVVVDFFNHLTETTRTEKMTGKQLHEYIFNPSNNVCITANGTIFRTDVDGIIPKLLGKWYSERKDMQWKEKEWAEKAKIAVIPEEKKEALYWVDFWNQRQQARKILLNSLYGALLNEALRFYDERLGQSVTLTGRTIVRHMNATINQLITGEYDYRGEGIVYADTDSCYFSAYRVLKDHPDYAEFEWSRDNIIMMYDLIAEETNTTFAEFMQRTFNTSLDRGAIIRAGRELVASKGLFIKKKKYAVMMYDKEGERLDKDGKPGKLKVMGLDLKRADTPKYMQEFLEKLLINLLIDKDKIEMYGDIKDFRRMFKTRPGWEKGSPKKVADLTGYTDKIDRSNRALSLGGKNQRVVKRDENLKVRIPGHVLASMNWNKLCEAFHDRHVVPITDGTRIIVCKLANNALGMTSIAYPIDEPHLPIWFKELPFDDAAMEETVIDKKLMNLVGVLEWNLTDTKEKAGDDLFTWN